MVPQELILSACSGVQASSSSAAKPTSSAPAIHLHDLATSAHVQAFKTSNNAAQSLAFTNSHDGMGGTVWAVQEGKAIVGIWAWQKVRLQTVASWVSLTGFYNRTSSTSSFICLKSCHV